jgi:hypothetical protein
MTMRKCGFEVLDGAVLNGNANTSVGGKLR